MSVKDVLMNVKYPVKVVMLENYENALDITFKEGMIVKEVLQTDNGALIGWYFKLKNDKSKTKIPAPDMQYYQNIMGKKKVYFLKLDRHTFWPITTNAGKLTVQVPYPVYETFEQDGKMYYQLDANKQRVPVLETVKVIDGNGKESTAKQQKIEYVDRMIFDTKLTMKDGKVIELPAMIANENYDKEAWLASEIEKAQRRYKLTGWLQNNATLIITVMGILCVMIVAYYTLQGIPKINAAQIDAAKEIAKTYATVIRGGGVNASAAPY